MKKATPGGDKIKYPISMNIKTTLQKIRKDVIGKELEVGDKVLFLWQPKHYKHRFKKAYITRFTKHCTFVCFKEDLKYVKKSKTKKERLLWEWKILWTSRKLIKHDWEKEWYWDEK